MFIYDCIVIHIIFGEDSKGLLQVWLNGDLLYNKKTSTVYSEYPWGGNNKWGVYHHTFNDYTVDNIQSSIDAGAGRVELFMGTLRMITLNPDSKKRGINYYESVRPK